MFNYRGYRHSPTTSIRKLLLGAIITSFTILFFVRFPNFTSYETLPYLSSPPTASCSPQDYVEGFWSRHPRTAAENMTSPDDALAFSGFENCASSREYYWHLAADREDQWDRFPNAQSWEWTPGTKCKGMRPLNSEDLVKHLVEDGGWYLVGGKCVIFSVLLGLIFF